MLTKQAKPRYKRLIGLTFKTILIAETIGVAVSYGLWYKLDTDRGKFPYFYASTTRNATIFEFICIA